MANSQSTRECRVTLSELTALNDEILALVRAGVPLDAGLRQLAGDLTGRTGRIARRLGEELAQGKSFREALASGGAEFPPVYLAVVEAGLQSGRLAAALETVARSTRRLADARRTIAASLVYPLFVFLVAWSLFVFFMTRLGPAFLRLFDDPSWPVARFLAAIVWLGRYGHIWGPLVPTLIVLVFACWAYSSSRASLLQPVPSGILLGWLPWLGPMVRSYRQGAFAEMLGLLVEHGLPLPHAIRLAAQATGTGRTRRGAEQIAQAIERGERLGGAVRHTAGFSPVLEWLLRSGHDTGTLRMALRHAADAYQRRARRLATSAQLYLAPLMTVVIGGTVTVAYTALTFGVWISLLKMMAGW
ncbi:MAG: type II secretion system F family protein [Thermoguttaceae bacterium]